VIARRKPLATPYDMSAYIIVEIEITDPVGYEEYKKLAGPTVEQHGGKYIVRGGACETLEGDWNPKRIVILQFENMERAKAWLHCPEYAEPRKMRHRTAKTPDGSGRRFVIFRITCRIAPISERGRFKVEMRAGGIYGVRA
jgi:uncharacterized protein (DUF1330 family)